MTPPRRPWWRRLLGPAAATAPVYRMVRPLGSGSVGQVFLAEDAATGQQVALKLFSPEPGPPDAMAQARERFLAEARLLARLKHPDIVRVVGAGEESGRLWMALEYVPGHDLSHYTQPARLLPEALVLRIGARVARALAHAHAQGMVHRDVKPANVRVELSSDQVKLGDFGIARLADAARTRTGVMLGTPAYMAPELLTGSEATPAADLHALGVMLFELLTGQRPYKGGSLGELMRAMAQSPVPDLRALRPDLSPVLADLLLRLMAKHPEERPSDAASVADALETLAGAAPAQAGSRAQSQRPEQ